MRAARRDLPALTRLWQACFGDTEAEVRAFWQALFDCTPVYLRRAPDGSPAAMLCALPAELVGDDGDAVPAAYLYAVCTVPALRGRGHCRLLLQEAEQDLKRQGIRAAVLVPAEESLFGFYARFGYRTVFTCRTETVPAARGDCSITPLTPDGWQSLRELQLYDSHLSYPPELLRWQETISRSSGAGLYRIETGDAVCCAAAERDGALLIAVTLNAPNDWEDHTALLDYGFSQVEPYQLAGGDVRLTVPVVGSPVEVMSLRGSNGGEVTLPLGQGAQVERVVRVPKFLYAPVEPGEQVGEICWYLEGQLLGSAPLTAAGAAPLQEKAPSLWERLFG